MTPTVSWPTPAPGAYFRSRYLGTLVDPVVPKGSSALLRGRVVDWRGLGIAGFKVHAIGERAQAEASSLADGQYTIVDLPPGNYEIRLGDHRSAPARGIPLMAGQVTTVDWIESAQNQPSPVPIAPSPTVPPTQTPSPVAASLVARPPSSGGIPSQTERTLIDLAELAAAQMLNAFLIGAALAALGSVAAIALSRRRT